MFRFIEMELPDSYELVARFFSKSGAYARMKDLLERNGKLQAWYDVEKCEIERALREWADEHSVSIQPKSSGEAPGNGAV